MRRRLQRRHERGGIAPMLTLTTDFGETDGFVAAMKGVIVSWAPHVPIVDVSHSLAPGDRDGASFVLSRVIPYCPRGSVHVAVVDPGVGSARMPIVVVTDFGLFVGPDNGILPQACGVAAVREVRQLNHPGWRLPSVSATFHGRDIFAPAAARLAMGAAVEEAGPQVETWDRGRERDVAVEETGGWTGCICYVDRFGNALTNVPNAAVGAAHAGAAGARVHGGGRIPLADCYAGVDVGEPVLVRGSGGTLEIAVRDGNASEQLGLRRGDRVRIELEK